MLLTHELFSFGLTQKEADVYLAALQLGFCSVFEISEKTNINRTTVYTHIKNLISRGLMSATERNGRLFYVAERPEKLQYIYEQQEKDLKRKKDILTDIMPELESIYNLAKDKPRVQYYNHETELDSLRKHIVNFRAIEMYNIFNYDLFKQHVSKSHIKGILASVEKFKVIYIAQNKIVDVRILQFLENSKIKIKYLPQDKYGFLCELTIADQHVIISREADSLIMSDQLFAQTIKLLFQTLWRLAEDL